ncbi:MAG: hypothetical protein AAFW60_03425 [Pseudomonadota bacterium]
MRNRLFVITIVPLSLLGLAACDGDDDASSSDDQAVNAAQLGPGATLAAACSGCHSDVNGAIASLSNYTEAQLQDTLARYKTEVDGTTVMHRLARGYSEEDIALVSAYLSQDEATR